MGDQSGSARQTSVTGPAGAGQGECRQDNHLPVIMEPFIRLLNNEFVILGPGVARSPQSITADGGNGYRTRHIVVPRDDIANDQPRTVLSAPK